MSKSSIFLSLYVSNCVRCLDDCFICIHLTWNSLFLPILKQAEAKRIHIPITKGMVMGVYPLYHNNFDMRWNGCWLVIRLRDLETLDLETRRHQIPEVWCLMSPSLLVPFISSTSAMQRHCCSFYNRLVIKSKKPILARILEGIGRVGTSPMASSFPAIKYKTWLFVPLPMRV